MNYTQTKHFLYEAINQFENIIISQPEFTLMKDLRKVLLLLQSENAHYYAYNTLVEIQQLIELLQSYKQLESMADKRNLQIKMNKIVLRIFEEDVRVEQDKNSENREVLNRIISGIGEKLGIRFKQNIG